VGEHRLLKQVLYNGKAWRLTAIRATPLIPPEAVSRVRLSTILEKLRRELFKQFKQELLGSALSPRAKIAFAKALQIEVKPKTLVVTVSHPGFKPLVYGQKRQQMTWLTKARAPIPIVTDDGRIVFRSATPRSMEDGRWIHPGRAKLPLFDRARKEAREKVRKRVAQEIRDQILAGMRKR